jgi:hypothetical protein
VETDSLAVPEAEAYMDADADSADKLAFLSANETDADTDSESLVEVLSDAAPDANADSETEFELLVIIDSDAAADAATEFELLIDADPAAAADSETEFELLVDTDSDAEFDAAPDAALLVAADCDADADSKSLAELLIAIDSDTAPDAEAEFELLRDAASLSLARLSSATAYDPEADSDCDSISEYTVFSLESRFCSAAKTISLLFTTPAPPIAIPAAAIPLIMLSTFFLSIWVPPQNKIAVQLCLTD